MLHEADLILFVVFVLVRLSRSFELAFLLHYSGQLQVPWIRKPVLKLSVTNSYLSS